MSVTTAAGEKLQSAKDHLSEAAKGLSGILVEECWGHDDYNSEYRQKMIDCLTFLLSKPLG